MAHKRNGLVPIASALADLPGPGKAIRETSPQARLHFTQADQVNQLVEAGEADPDRGFMARLMALCSLPRTNPGNQHQYKCVNGPAWPELNYSTAPGVLILHPSTPAIPPAQQLSLVEKAPRVHPTEKR